MAGMVTFQRFLFFLQKTTIHRLGFGQDSSGLEDIEHHIG